MPPTKALAPVRSAGVRSGAPLPVRQKRPGYVALGVALILGPAAFGAWYHTHADQKTPMVVVIQTVPVGQAITRADLSTIAVAGGVQGVAGADLDTVIGQKAALTLQTHWLLQPSMITSGSGIGSGQSEVGVAVTSGQIPADGLDPGDTVQVLRLPAAEGSGGSGDSTDQAQELVAQARVFAVRADPAQAGGTLLTLTVPSSDAAYVATASGAGQVALVKVAAKT